MPRTEQYAKTQPCTPMPVVIIAAWAVLSIYGMLEGLFVVLAIAAGDSVESATMVAYAVAAALPLIVMFVVLLFSTIHRTRVGPWFCIAIGVLSLVALIALIAS